MPMPPTLPLIEWPKVFASGESYDQWITNKEYAENCKKMDEDRRGLRLAAPVEGALKALPKTVHVLAIAEAWCGDVVRHVPVLQRMAEATDRVQVRYISRQQHPDVFARFLTNGGEAIPKFVFLSQDFVECGNWGPMPWACRLWIARGKAAGDGAKARERVGALYAADPNRTEVARELLELMEIAATEQV
ncbi:MAG TPA: thioredoxin family protein [Candidatus Sumerlaeota bacterium]|nr:thioredoxin family protein [Candidatus Sumerlaeota bacterium]HOR29170.1 thioredoxin family protein [Candidatus Sumerlaeota bacterium]HPK00961.1 thioredoxin family protein [Candidatus Sumerlaeota bacterium]